MNTQNEKMRYIEGSTLANGWHYRISRVTKPDGEVEYTGLLSHRDFSGGDHLRFLCLARYATLRETRAAVYDLLPTTVRAIIASMQRLSFLQPEQISS